MMKINCDDNCYIIPFNTYNNKTIIVTNAYKNEIIDCLNSYFVSHKKSKCNIYDDDKIIDNNELNFIYLSNDLSFDNNFNFKAKSLIHNNVLDIIINNPEYFLSLDVIRKEIQNLETDKGFYRIKNILSKGLNTNIDIELNDFDLSNILQMFSIKALDLSDSIKQLIILNLVLYINRNKTNIVYIDRFLDSNLDFWIKTNNYDNVFYLIDNESLSRTFNDYNLLIMSNNNHLIETIEEDYNISLLSYMHHDIVKNNISLQNEKNIEVFNRYYDKNSTFFIKNLGQPLLEIL